MQEVPDLVAQHAAAVVSIFAVAPNPSIERTFQRLLRALWAAAHVER